MALDEREVHGWLLQVRGAGLQVALLRKERRRLRGMRQVIDTLHPRSSLLRITSTRALGDKLRPTPPH